MTNRVMEMAALDRPEEVELLYWVGCAVAADERLHGIAHAMVRILNRAGIRFAVLGQEEQCTGDPARRTGNEFHFVSLAEANIATLNRYGVRRIVTHCPHCLHTIKNEYPRFGGEYEIVHHTTFIRRLMDEGRICLSPTSRAKLTFHDPCYLGRANGIFDAPRAVLDGLGGERVEMQRSRERSFCCGAGGGHSFFEDAAGGKINENRAREALDTGASTVCTACPFCLSMMEEGVVTAGGEGAVVRVLDLAELVDELLEQDENHTRPGQGEA